MIFTHKSKALSRPLLTPNPIRREQPNPIRREQPNPIRREQPKPATPQEVKATAKPMRWGAPTWLFFHTLAEKVREDQFPLIRGPLLNMISNVCANLPCPDCAKHAREYMAKINFNAIRTKDDFKELFFGFHNTVNARKGFPIADKTELDKYAQYSLVSVITNFMHYFENRHMSPRLMSDDFSRRHTAANIKQWITANMASFHN